MIQPQQIKQIQTICSKRFTCRYERLSFISDFFGREVKTTKDLTELEAHNLIYFLNTGKEPNNAFYAKFDKGSTQHRNILSLVHQLGWVQEENPRFVDLNRLGSWIISGKCPVQKQIVKMKPKEISKVIFALEQMLTKKYKN